MGTFELWDKIYLRLHENVLEISLKIVYEKIWAFQTRGTSHLNITIFVLFHFVRLMKYTEAHLRHRKKKIGVITSLFVLCRKTIGLYMYITQNNCVITQNKQQNEIRLNATKLRSIKFREMNVLMFNLSKMVKTIKKKISFLSSMKHVIRCWFINVLLLFTILDEKWK